MKKNMRKIEILADGLMLSAFKCLLEENGLSECTLLYTRYMNISSEVSEKTGIIIICDENEVQKFISKVDILILDSGGIRDTLSITPYSYIRYDMLFDKVKKAV
jgi:hypothetical protein